MLEVQIRLSIGDLIFGQKNVLSTINLNIVVFIYLDTLLILRYLG